MWNYNLTLKFHAKIKEYFVTYDIKKEIQEKSTLVRAGEGSSYRESTIYVWRATVKKETIKIGSHKGDITYIQVDGITHIINARKWRKWKR